MRRFAGLATGAALSVLVGSGAAVVAAAPAQAAPRPQDATTCSQILAAGGFSGSTGHDQKLLDKACAVASKLGPYSVFERTLQQIGVGNQNLIRRAYQAAQP